MMTQPELICVFEAKPWITYAPKRKRERGEYKVVCVRECDVPDDPCDTPERAVEFWRQHITASSMYDSMKECCAVVFLNVRRRITGFHMVSIGTLDSALIHPREVYRPAIIAASSAVILMHNHPSGDPAPSDADIRVTRDIARAGQLLKIELLDSIVIGQTAPGRHKGHTSLRELGCICP